MGKNTYGTSVAVTIFGESHGAAVGAVLDGIAPGIPVDPEWIRHQLSLRRPWGSISTGRRETDEFEILSGVFEGRTTGTPICIVIRNRDTRSKDYTATRARVVVDSVTALVLCDLLALRFGTDWLRGE